MPSGIGAPEILIVAVVVMVLFGAKRLPDSARALGRSMRIFKAETKGLRSDEDATLSAQQQPAQLPPAPLPPAQAADPDAHRA